MGCFMTPLFSAEIAADLINSHERFPFVLFLNVLFSYVSVKSDQNTTKQLLMKQII